MAATNKEPHYAYPNKFLKIKRHNLLFFFPDPQSQKRQTEAYHREHLLSQRDQTQTEASP